MRSANAALNALSMLQTVVPAAQFVSMPTASRLPPRGQRSGSARVTRTAWRLGHRRVPVPALAKRTPWLVCIMRHESRESRVMSWTRLNEHRPPCPKRGQSRVGPRGQPSRFLVSRRTLVGALAEVDEVLEIWVRRDLDPGFARVVWVGWDAGSGSESVGMSSEPAGSAEEVALGIRRSVWLSGLWAERHRCILGAFVRVTPSERVQADRFFSAFDATESRRH